MEDKNKYLYSETAATLALIILTLFIFGKTLGSIRQYYLLALSAGFCFSWFMRGKDKKQINALVLMGLLSALAWIFYSLFNSSLVYRQAVLIVIKGALIIEIILSFNAFEGSFLAYMQALSIPIFMANSIFKNAVNEVYILLVFGYLIAWLAIFKIKFYEVFRIPDGEKIRQKYLFLVPALFLLAITVFSWIAFSKFPLSRVTKAGLLPEEGQGQSGLGDKEYYALKDKVQKEITGLATGGNVGDKGEKMIFMLSPLMQESPNAILINKAENGLISLIKEEGLGLEERDKQDFVALIRDFINKKINFNLDKGKEKTVQILKQQPFDLAGRIGISGLMDKLTNSNSRQKIKEYKARLEKYLKESSLGKAAKEGLSSNIKQLADWKAFDAYRKSIDSLSKNQDTSNPVLKEKTQDLLNKIEQEKAVSDFKEIDSELKDMKQSDSPAERKTALEIEKISDLKLEMLVADKARTLKEKINSSGLPDERAQELRDNVERMKDAASIKDLSRESEDFRYAAGNEKMEVSSQTQDLLEAKNYQLAREQIRGIEEVLKETILPDQQKKEFLDSAENSVSTKSLIGLEKLKEASDKFLKQGFMNEQTREKLASKLNELKDILSSQARAKEEELAKKEEQSNTAKKLEQLIQEASLKEDARDALKKLAEELSKADSLPKIDDIKQAMEDQIKSSEKQDMLKDKSEILKAVKDQAEMQKVNAMNKAFSNISKGIDKLQDSGPQKSKLMEESLRKIMNASSRKDLKEKIEKLEDEADSGRSSKNEDSSDSQANWRIYVMPSNLILPAGSSTSLRAIGVYNNLFIKEIAAESEWISSNPNVVTIDRSGGIHCIASGEAEVSVKYRGMITKGPQIKVLDKIPEDIEKGIKSGLNQ